MSRRSQSSKVSGPFDFARARRLGRFWPKDDSIDDFVATVRRWRDEGGDGEMPGLKMMNS